MKSAFAAIQRAAIIEAMAFPIKTCVACGEEFELRPDKPGFANRCPQCSEPEAGPGTDANDVLASDREANAARRAAIKEMLYSRK